MPSNPTDDQAADAATAALLNRMGTHRAGVVAHIDPNRLDDIAEANERARCRAGWDERTALGRYPCPECGRHVCTRDGQVYRSVRDGEGRSHLYVHLRRHNSAPGVRCAGWHARHDPPAVA